VQIERECEKMKEEVKIVKRECDVCYVVEGKKG
jgi:hypothetical protein